MLQRVRLLGLAGLAAVWALGMLPAAQGEALLEPDQAFRPSARFVAGEASRIEITYRIAPGYYLYRDRFRVAIQPQLPVGEVEQAPGEEIDDPFVGRVRIFRDSVALGLPLTASAPPGMYRLRITAQGCAEERFCYRPFVQEVQVRVPAP
jgi:thiol:disulfide interchange protein DsbD